MAADKTMMVSSRAIHPGEFLREELKERGIKQKNFANMIGVQATHLNEFIKGKRNMNESLAIKLERSLDIPYDTWMDLHKAYIYDLKVLEKRNAEEKKAMEFESACSNAFNIHAFYKRIGIASLTCIERVGKLRAFFNFDILSSTERGLQVAGLYKHSEKVQIDGKNMMTWLLLNWLEISRIYGEIAPYVQGNALKAADDIARMANACDINADKIKECLNRYGIWYLVVEKLDKAPIDAYSTFNGDHPVITVTYRYNDLDKLVFDILHELCHIDKHLHAGEEKAFISVEGSDYSNDKKETEANDFARQMLIPDSVWNGIMRVGCKNLNPYKIVKTIADAAKERGVSPSIAVARYKHEANWYRTSAYKSPKIR